MNQVRLCLYLYLYFILFNKLIRLILEENGVCNNSNSSWINTESNGSNWIQIYPLTLTTKLVYCLKYLVPTGEYQEVCNTSIKYNKYYKINIILVSKSCI